MAIDCSPSGYSSSTLLLGLEISTQVATRLVLIGEGCGIVLWCIGKLRRFGNEMIGNKRDGHGSHVVVYGFFSVRGLRVRRVSVLFDLVLSANAFE